MCTIFVASDGKVTLVGNNEDFVDPFTRVWYIPKEGGEIEGKPFYGGRYGRVYFGYRDLFPQGGMNEKGLFFDYTAQPPLAITQSVDKPAFQPPEQLPDYLWANCATVKEALAVLDKYNLAGFERACLHMADPSGDAVLFEGDEVLWKQGRYQVGTNFYQSQWDARTPPPCDRYRIATQMLEDAAEINVALIRRVLMATHQEGVSNTVYSNIYDLKNGLVYLYHFHNFENMVVIDLAKELEKGLHILDIPALFPETFAALSNVRQIAFNQEKERLAAERFENGEFLHLPEEDLAALAGRYRGEWLGGVEYNILAVEGDLYARYTLRGMEGMPLTQVYPLSADECVLPSVRGESRCVFGRDEEGKVVSLEVKQPGGWGYSMEKVVGG